MPMYQRQGASAFKKDLTNIQAFSLLLDQPEKKYPSIHVAGTNGKGSTSHLLASILQSAGISVGLYTSPHLKDFRERIKINGNCISEEEVIEFIEKYHEFLEKQGLSFFELTVGMAFDHFAAHEVDLAIIEVGLGGRLDSTNIIDPLVSVITNIGLDHTQFLGDTLKEIAFEKGGIIKSNTPVVIGELQEEVIEVFEELAQKRQSELFVADKLVEDEFNTDLIGSYQQKNVKTAVQTIRLLKEKGIEVSEEAIEHGLTHVAEQTGLKGRWQIISEQPRTICDTAHNREGLSLVLNQLSLENFERLHIVLGVVNDKSLDQILKLFPKEASYYFCRPDIPRGLDAETLQNQARQFNLQGVVYNSVIEAYHAALKRADKKDLIYAGGSTFVVAEMPI